MMATWKNNSVEYVQWNGSNLYEIENFVGNDHKVFMSTDGSGEIYVNGIGTVGKNDYLCRSKNYAYNPIQIYSWKVFPRIVNEDIGTGSSI